MAYSAFLDYDRTFLDNYNDDIPFQRDTILNENV